MKQKCNLIIISVVILIICLIVFNYPMRALFQNIARNTKNSFLCPFSIDNDNCYAYIAMYKQNPELCNKVSETSTWKDQCYMDLGGRMNNLDLCMKITKENQKSQCITSIAMKRNDTNICLSIKDVSLQLTCTSWVNGNKN